MSLDRDMYQRISTISDLVSQIEIWYEVLENPSIDDFAWGRYRRQLNKKVLYVLISIFLKVTIIFIYHMLAAVK